MKGLITFILVFSFVLGIAGQAKATNESQAAVLLLLIEPGARAWGMGKAFRAVTDDASASFYNPANLARRDKENKNLTFMHMNWLPAMGDDMYYEYAGYAQHFEGWGNFAFNLVYFSLGEQNRTSEIGTHLGTFKSFDVAGSISYGVEMSKNWDMGMTLKGVYSSLAPGGGAGSEKGKGVGSTFAVDFGATYHTPLKRLTLTATLHNIGPRISYIDVVQADPIPLNFVLGSAYKILDSEFNDLIVALDLYKPLVTREVPAYRAILTAWGDEGMKEEFEQVDLHVGAEYVYAKSFALRAGYFYDKDGEIKSPTFGVGLKYDFIHVDVAYISAQDNPLQDSTRFSITFDF